jgi:hypothetical protein
MTGLPEQQTWHRRVAELLDDPVGRAVLRRDGLTHGRVLEQLAPIARHLRAIRREALHAHHRDVYGPETYGDDQADRGQKTAINPVPSASTSSDSGMPRRG